MKNDDDISPLLNRYKLSTAHVAPASLRGSITKRIKDEVEDLSVLTISGAALAAGGLAAALVISSIMLGSPRSKRPIPTQSIFQSNVAAELFTVPHSH